MNKYPYIGESRNNGAVVLFHSKNHGSQLWRGNANYQEIWNESLFKNITAERLTNTYGKVESKEHAEFIVKLAENAGFKVKYLCGYVASSEFFCINEDKLMFLAMEDVASDSGEKLITIPLPPKEDEEDMKQTEVKATAAMRTVINLGYTYHGGELWKPPLGDIKCNHEQFLNRCSEDAESARKALWSDCINRSKEWPQVGDEVLTKETSKATIIAIYERFAWIENFEGYLGMEIVAIEELKKPPTPEEELTKELEKMVYDGMDNSYDLNHNCYYLVSGLMKKYDIKKKPE